MDQESGLAHDSKFDCSLKKKKQLVMIIDNTNHDLKWKKNKR
jgi:hypothetical protein